MDVNNSTPAVLIGGHMEGMASQPKLLRILCLHGFRQTAKNFAGRTAALRKRLKHIAELVFVDAPHELPCLARAQGTSGSRLEDPPELADTTLQHASSQQEQSVAELTLKEQAGRAQTGQAQHQQQQQHPKRAWLLHPQQYTALKQRHSEIECNAEAMPGSPAAASICSQEWDIDKWQFLHQTAGWPESWQHIQHVFVTQEPFDGVLGFSQGAAVAAVLCALQEEHQLCTAMVHTGHNSQAVAGGGLGPIPAAVAAASQDSCHCWAAPGSTTKALAASFTAAEPVAASGMLPSAAGLAAKPATGPAHGLPPLPLKFKFAIICSGYISPVAEHRALLLRARQRAGICLPSLHVFGSGSEDRQISAQESRQLAACFAASQSSVVEHSMGHLIPSSKPIMEELRSFLTAVSHY